MTVFPSLRGVTEEVVKHGSSKSLNNWPSLLGASNSPAEYSHIEFPIRNLSH